MKSTAQLFVTILSVLTGLALSSCGKQATPGNTDKTPPVDVRIEILRPSRLVDGIQVAGTVKASGDANLSPEEGGVVKEWQAKKGQVVKKGDLILVLRDEVMKAGYDAADAQYKIAELNLEKQQKVYEEQGISELQLKSLQVPDAMQQRQMRT